MTTTKDVATKRPPTLANLIDQMRPEIARALPRHMNPDRMARLATTVLRQTPALARTTPESFLGALMTASQLGLEPGPLGEAYFVPYGNACTFIPGYRGLVKLARQSGQLVDIWAEVVYEADDFTYRLGLHRDLNHVPNLTVADRGKPVYVYAAAELRDGGRPFVVMTFAEVEAIRARSKAGRSGPWVTDWAPMAKKTAIRQLSKWLPLSAEFTAATVMDGAVRTEIGQLVDATPTYIDGEAEEAPAPAPAVDAGLVADPQDAEVIPADDPEPGPAEPPAEVVMASRKQLAQLKQIRDAEKYDADLEWFGFLSDLLGEQITKASDITSAQADKVLATFTEQEN